MPRVGLTPAAVVDAALALLDEAGPDAVTLAAVADRVGVRSPSLYRHVDGLDGLREQMAVRVAQDLAAAVTQAQAAHDGDHVARVRAGLHAYRDWVRASPARHALLPVAPAEPGELRDASERLVGIAVGWVEPWGRTGDDAIHAVRGLRSLVHGFCVIEAAGGFAMDVDVDESFERLVDLALAGLAAP